MLLLLPAGLLADITEENTTSFDKTYGRCPEIVLPIKTKLLVPKNPLEEYDILL
jgi:hypothetical protein